MLSKVLNGAASPANCARKIAGPLSVRMRASSIGHVRQDDGPYPLLPTTRGWSAGRLLATRISPRGLNCQGESRLLQQRTCLVGTERSGTLAGRRERDYL